MPDDQTRRRERFLQPLGLHDPEKRGGIALPALLVIHPDGILEAWTALTKT